MVAGSQLYAGERGLLYALEQSVPSLLVLRGDSRSVVGRVLPRSNRHLTP